MGRIATICVLLCGCATNQAHRDAVANEAMAQCARMGYVVQSAEWRQCAQNLYLATTQAEAARRQQAAHDFAAAAAAMSQSLAPPQAPQTVLCRQSYAGVYCQ